MSLFFQYPRIKTCFFLCSVTWYQLPSVWDLVMKPWAFLPLLSWHFEHGCDKQGVDLTVELLKMKPDISTLVLLALNRFPEVLSFGQIQLCRSAIFFFFLVRRHFLLAALSIKPYLASFFLIMLLWTSTFKVLTEACFCIFGLLLNK